jgi:hypothetical protein
MEKAQRKGPKKKSDFGNSPAFYEELAILNAQETIAELLESSQTTKTELASRLGQTKAHVTELLSEDRNLTLRSFGRVCFHLGAEIVFNTRPIGQIQYAPERYHTNLNISGSSWVKGSLWSAPEVIIHSGSGVWEVQMSGAQDSPPSETGDDVMAA